MFCLMQSAMLIRSITKTFTIWASRSTAVVHPTFTFLRMLILPSWYFYIAAIFYLYLLDVFILNLNFFLIPDFLYVLVGILANAGMDTERLTIMLS